MATPAGLAAEPPAVGTLSAVAAPCGSLLGCLGCWGCGASGGPAGLCDCAFPAASGYVVTGCKGACDGLTLVPPAGGFCCVALAGAWPCGGEFAGAACVPAPG